MIQETQLALLAPVPQHLEVVGDAHPWQRENVEERVGRDKRAQAYRLTIRSGKTVIESADDAGAYYGRCTLLQLLRIYPDTVPDLDIEDWPDFLHRGVMLDISRDKVPSMATLKHLIELLASLKINQLQFYTEHTFAYEGHETVWRNASPLTSEEVRTLDDWCRQHHVELVANQNSFGHFHRWLIHPEYNHLAERPEGIEHAFSLQKEPFGLCPVEPGCLELLDDLYGQLVPNFSSRVVNVGLDETIDLGTGGSSERCEQRGQGAVYLDFVKQINELLLKRGCTMQMWGDIILNYPDLIVELPDQVTVLEWGYESDHPFETHAAQFAAAGREFYVCPGTSSWNSLLGRTDNALGNLRNAAIHGHGNGATGYLITDWGDNGHLQPLVVSYPGYLAGASYSWNVGTAVSPESFDVAGALNTHVFMDKDCQLGALIMELGNAYRRTDVELKNRTLAFVVLLFPEKNLPRLVEWGVSKQTLEDCVTWLRTKSAELADMSLDFQGAEADVAGLRWAVDATVLGLSIAIAGAVDGFAAEYHALATRHRQIWSFQNRPGGLNDSAYRLERFV